MSRLLLAGLVLLGALFGAGGVWLAERIAPGALAPADKARMGGAVREYLLANPEIIPQAMDRLRERENGRAVAASRAAIETPVGDAWIGNPNGDVTLVEYFDYNCGYCRAMLPTIRELVQDDPDVRVVFQELPILAETSRDASRASLAAAVQGKFDRFHEALYSAGPVTKETIAAVAQSAGVDLSQPYPRTDEQLRNNLDVAAKLGMNGTPSWIIGDRVLTGALPLDQLKEAVAAARAR